MDFDFEVRASESPMVEQVWRTRTEQDGDFTSVASTNWEMVIFKHRGKMTLTLRGPETKPSPVEVEAGIEFTGITFKVGTFMPHLPINTIMNRQDLHLPEATSKSFYLYGTAWQFPDFENADTFVERLVRQELLVQDAVVRDVLHNHHPPEVTERTVRRHFLRATGLTYSTILQIERARQAAELLGRGCSILDAVFEAGYYDQAHLTRSLKRFMGQTPAQLLLPNQSK